MEKIISLSDRNNVYKKYEAIKAIGYEVTTDEFGVTLKDNLNPHADNCIDTRFRNINEVLRVLNVELGRAKILVVA